MCWSGGDFVDRFGFGDDAVVALGAVFGGFLVGLETAAHDAAERLVGGEGVPGGEGKLLVNEELAGI